MFLNTSLKWRSRFASGFNLISITISTAILSLIVFGAMSAVYSSIHLDSVSFERNIALREVERILEDVQSLDRNSFVAEYDPSIVGSAKFFNVGALEPQKDSNGTVLPTGLIVVSKPSNTPFNQSFIFTVYVEVRWRNNFAGDLTQGYTLIVAPPESFD